ncbi:hypothetical protein [Providencia sp. PROV147]|uniref:hypothetical protein n=1 Tax=Providencia sp. PROV147 TaxID=2949857 RepID=UPI0023494174|nr:hypothetical protein [Providencia sp. PROV147]
MMNRKQKIATLQILAIREDIGVSAFNSIISEINNGIDLNKIINLKNNKIKSNNDGDSVSEKNKITDEISKYLKLMVNDENDEIKNLLAYIDMVSLIGDTNKDTIENVFNSIKEKNNKELNLIRKKIINFKERKRKESYSKLANFIIEK